MLNRHGQLAWDYWRTYRPRALADLGGEREQEQFFQELGLRVIDRIGELTDAMLQKLSPEEQARQRAAVQQQATELVYSEEIYLPKEEGTEHREL